MSDKYKMTISRLTVDKLGVKLYDRISAVIAELVANAYDADATEVEIKAPMGEYLATKKGGEVFDSGYNIIVRDNGIGMDSQEINDFFLKVGSERRTDGKRGDISKKYTRKVMGRKGVGKLAPFGVCREVEIISLGGTPQIKKQNGIKRRFFKTSHLFLDKSKILQDTDKEYNPEPGERDEKYSPKGHGTSIKLSMFDRRKVPDIDSFERQLARRFGVSSPNWKIKLIDTNKTVNDPDYSRTVGQFNVEKMENTELVLQERESGGKTENIITRYDGKTLKDLKAGFEFDGKFYPVTGWVAYSKKPYKDSLMAGVRIYCRGKIAAQTNVFNLKAGFTGEYDIRSYLIGELYVDWLDEDEDLIQTTRQDILWSHELGHAFEKWGQILVKKIGKITRGPKKKRAWEVFQELSKIHEKVEKAFPSKDQKAIKDNTIEVAKIIAQTAREEEMHDEEFIDQVMSLSFLFGPNITLDRKLREAVEDENSPVSVVNGILKTARIAELSAFGRIADQRVKVIKKIESLKDDKKTIEAEFQRLINEAPWLINPQWAPITSNRSFATLKREFKKYYQEKTGEELNIDDFNDPNKQPDFVMANLERSVEIIEIKRPNYALKDSDFKRLSNYISIMDEFLEKPGHSEFKKFFPEFRVTLVCDDLSLDTVSGLAFEGLVNNGKLVHITWTAFLLRTQQMHQEFLNEAEKQRENAATS